jgi:hypothetical protein
VSSDVIAVAEPGGACGRVLGLLDAYRDMES